MQKMLLSQLLLLLVLHQASTQEITEDQMKIHLENYDRDSKTLANLQSLASWAVQTDVNNQTKAEAHSRAIEAYATYRKEQFDLYWKNATLSSYTDPHVQRKLTFLKNIGTAILEAADLNNLTQTRSSMSAIYNTARICPYETKDTCNLLTDGLYLDPGIELALSKSEIYDEQLYLWEKWREESGKKMRNDYKKYIEIYNKAAAANNFTDAGAMWRSRYEDENLVEKVDKLWSEVEPLYSELHTYVRYKLQDRYPELDKADPNIPAHLFGNMWAQNWVHLYERTKPFDNGSIFDVTEKIEQTMSVPQMFEKSDEFYQSLGLPSSAMSYGPKAMIERPLNGTAVACHASAWDFSIDSDFRIKMCTKKNLEDFIVVHHEMGHIMYYLLYEHLPLIYRGGANPGFHEAVGDTIALSVSTPKHLKAIGLLESNFEDSYENDINSLYHMALERVAFLPFGLLIDKWRWDLFSGATPESEWNKHWWELREKYQKIRAPTPRGEEFFDPGAKYHIPADSQYIAYFVAHILQFSFYKSLCIAAGQYNPNNSSSEPLHKCDYYQNKEAGQKLRDGLEIGMSEHWGVALEALTESSEMSSTALVEYFKPLYDFLKEENKKTRIQRMNSMLEQYEDEGSKMCNKLVKADWAVATDADNNEAKDIYAKTVLENQEFTQKWYESTFKDANPDDFSEKIVKRQLKYLTKLGRDALEPADLTELTNTITSMTNIYNTAEICPFANQTCTTGKLPLEPELQEIMGTSEDYDELLWTWTEWREKSGKQMREHYKKYLEMNKKTAELNGFTDFGEMWRDAYEDEKFVENIDKMWSQVEPLYDELHKYVRRKLKTIYGDKLDISDDLIPAHVLGNMWAQSWINLYERIKPFKDGSSIDITETMKAKNITVEKMFEMSNDFFMGLGLPNNSMSYQEPLAVINKPEDRRITCHASAWDFCDGEDFRIKQCTSINQEDFITVHHEMGHINYFILYKDQPLVLRTGANPGFHEAVGDLIALSVSTPQHLKKVNLLDSYADNEADNINALFKMALERVAFLPFGLLIDKWRWDLFSGKTPESEWNKHWWELREKYQKVKSPTPRGEEFFDPGAKFHIPADYQYIAYFVAHILEFQLHRAVCIEAGEYIKDDPNKPLHKCDIDNSKEAGDLIKAGLKLGLSEHWSEALKAMTNETEISGEALFDYFQPLYDYLKTENDKDGSTVIKFNVFLLIGIALVKFFF